MVHGVLELWPTCHLVRDCPLLRECHHCKSKGHTTLFCMYISCFTCMCQCHTTLHYLGKVSGVGGVLSIFLVSSSLEDVGCDHEQSDARASGQTRGAVGQVYLMNAMYDPSMATFL